MKRYLFLFVLVLVACKKEVIPDPEPALLIGPVNNDNCNTAIVLNDQKSQVNFSWQEAAHTDEYELVVRDILTNMDQKNKRYAFFQRLFWIVENNILGGSILYLNKQRTLPKVKF